jgi:hypothetical protein
VTSLTLQSGNGITDSGTITVSSGLSATTDANSAVITLDQIDVTGGRIGLTTDGSGDATISNGSAIDFGASNVGGNLSATAGTGDITETGGALTVTGTADFTVPDASDIYLANQANDIAGDPSFATSGTGYIANLRYRNTNTGATLPAVGNVTTDVEIIFNNTGVDLPAMTVGGNLDVTAGGNITDSGAVDVGSGTLTLYAAGTDYTVTLDDGPPVINNLTIDVLSQTITMNNDFSISGNLTIINGTFDLGGNDFTLTTTDDSAGDVEIQSGGTLDADASGAPSGVLTVGGDWNNFGTFVHRENLVVFNKAAPNTVEILGANTFYDFRYEEAGGTIAFESGVTQTVDTNGNFRVVGASGNNISLTATSPVNGNSSTYWTFEVLSGGTYTLQYVYIEYSIASPAQVAPPDVNINEPETIDWLLTMPVSDSYTIDQDGDGKLDRILVEFPVDIQPGADYSDLVVSVDGYELHDSNPYEDGPLNTQMYIVVQEKPYLDTGVTPDWRIESNNQLRDAASDTRKAVSSDPETPNDVIPPVIGYTLALPGRDEVLMTFSEEVINVNSGNISYAPGGYSVDSVTAPPDNPATDREYLLHLNQNLLAQHILDEELLSLSSNIQDTAGNPVRGSDGGHPSYATYHGPPDRHEHRVTDTGTDIIQPAYAINTTVSRDPERGANVANITSFDGSDWLLPQELRIEANTSGLGGNPDIYVASDVSDYYLSTDNTGLWLPDFNESNFSGIVPFPNTGVDAASSIIDSTTGDDTIAVHTIPDGNPALQNDVKFDFFYEYPVGLYHGRCTDPSASDWYRKIRPWSIDLHAVREQTGRISVLNNVINPRTGEAADLHYILKESGRLTIQVFTLAGDLVDTLYRGNRSPGEYATSWDGRNKGGDIVARGIYFIRFTGPGLDEFRKVLVVK